MKLHIKNSSVLASGGASSSCSGFHGDFGNPGKFGGASEQMSLLGGVLPRMVCIPCTSLSQSSERCSDGNFWNFMLIKGLEIFGFFLKFEIGRAHV